MSGKGIYKYSSDLVSTFRELVELSINNATVEIVVTNKNPVKTNISTITFCLRLKHRNKNF